MKQMEIKIKGMHCHSCVALIEDEVKQLPGVEAIKVNLDAANARVEFDESAVDVSQIKKTIAELGYQAEG